MVGPRFWGGEEESAGAGWREGVEGCDRGRCILVTREQNIGIPQKDGNTYRS
jgi:hypothetical protein